MMDMALLCFMMQIMHYVHTKPQKNGIEIIATTFNINTRRAIHGVAIYEPPTTHIQSFLQLLESIYVKASHNFPTIFIGDFNVNMLKNTITSKQLVNYMHQCKFTLNFQESTTIHDSQLDYTWNNAILTTCQLRSTKAYWTNHKTIFFAFKLPNHVPRFCFTHKKYIKWLKIQNFVSFNI
jgi:hypothetical protein